MKDYYSIPQFAEEYLHKKDERDVNEWIYNYLLYGETSPLRGVSPEKKRSALIKVLYVTINQPSWRYKIRNAIREISKSTPIRYFSDQALIEFLKVIPRLNLTELLPVLYKYANEQDFKGRKSKFIPDFMDIHTRVLKSLFGLEVEKDGIDNIIAIAKRDIYDVSYMLECFHYLSANYKNSAQCVKYIPYLLLEAKSKTGDYEKVVAVYLSKFPSELSEKIRIIYEETEKMVKAKKLEETEKWELLELFQKILSDIGNDNCFLETILSLQKKKQKKQLLGIFFYKSIDSMAKDNKIYYRTMSNPTESTLNQFQILC